MTAGAGAAEVDARIVGEALVASFMKADPPKVWRTDMGKLSGATLELRSDGARFRMVMIAGQGEEDVAVFNDRGDGTAALQAVMQAMFTQAGTGAPPAAAPGAAQPRKRGFFGWLLRVFLWLVAAGVALLILAGLFTADKTGQLISAISSGASGTVAVPGAPVSADEFFR